MAHGQYLLVIPDTASDGRRRLPEELVTVSGDRLQSAEIPDGGWLPCL